MNISNGIISSAQKIVIYGPEGIGKSTFASKFPNPLFSDTEGSTKKLNVNRFDKPTSWTMLMQQIEYVKNNPSICQTYIIDTIYWAEQLCISHICTVAQKQGIEDFGYGKGYIHEKEEFGRMLNKLTELIDIGINVVITAHAQLKKFEQPDELGSYDRWEMKLGQKTSSQISPLVKEWADMVLFANYKTFAVSVDDKGKKFKAQGGARIMHTTHHPCWDAKNRDGLPEEMPMDFTQIAHCVPDFSKKLETVSDNPTQSIKQPTENKSIEGPAKANFEELLLPWERPNEVVVEDLSDLPKPLSDLMKEKNVTKKEIQWAVAEKGYFPEKTPICNYGEEFINGVLIGAWPKVLEMIEKYKQIPF